MNTTRALDRVAEATVRRLHDVTMERRAWEMDGINLGHNSKERSEPRGRVYHDNCYARS